MKLEQITMIFKHLKHAITQIIKGKKMFQIYSRKWWSR